MKHQIIQYQWEQLTEKQQQEWQIKISENHLPYISEMIEFLGDDWIRQMIYVDKKTSYCGNDKLCDTLWKCVKYKLKNL